MTRSAYYAREAGRASLRASEVLRAWRQIRNLSPNPTPPADTEARYRKAVEAHVDALARLEMEYTS